MIEIEKRSREVVITKVGDMVAKARVGSDIPSIMTPTNLMIKSLDIKVVDREMYSLKKGYKCYICSGPHSYKKCPKLNSLSVIPWERRSRRHKNRCNN